MVSEQVKLPGKSIKLSVYYDRQQLPWAEYNLNVAKRCLRATVDYTKETPGFEEIQIFARDQVFKGSTWYGAVSEKNQVELEYRLGYYPLTGYLCREIVKMIIHTNVQWFNQGMSAQLPLIAAAQNKISFDHAEFIALNQMYHDPQLFISKRPLLYENLDEFRNRKEYDEKCYKSAVILRSVMPAGRLQQVYQQVAKAKAEIKNTKDILNLLNSVKKFDYEKSLQGWVFKGNFSQYHPGLFDDKDDDGLSNIMESILETDFTKPDTDDDSIHDFAEIMYSSDASRADDASIYKNHTPIIDGFSSEYQGNTVFSFVPQPENMFKRILLIQKNDHAYFYIEAMHAVLKNNQISLKINWEGKTSKSTALFSLRPRYSYHQNIENLPTIKAISANRKVGARYFIETEIEIKGEPRKYFALQFINSTTETIYERAIIQPGQENEK